MSIDIEDILNKIDQNPNLSRKLYEILRDRFATREEFQKLLEEIQKSREESNKRFEAMDKRFEEQRSDFNKQFEAIHREVKILGISFARIETKEGSALEKAVLDVMRETLQLENINPDKINKIQLQDKSGEIFYPGFSSDIDILIENSNIYLFEIKARANSEDIAHFLQISKLYEKITGRTPTTLYLVALRTTKNTKELADRQAIKMLIGDYID